MDFDVAHAGVPRLETAWTKPSTLQHAKIFEAWRVRVSGISKTKDSEGGSLLP